MLYFRINRNLIMFMVSLICVTGATVLFQALPLKIIGIPIMVDLCGLIITTIVIGDGFKILKELEETPTER